MPLPILPVIVISLCGVAWHKQSKEKGPGKGVLTPERQMIFDSAMNDCKEPAKLKKLAEVFSEQGLPAQADMLNKRARLREMPMAQKLARREVFRRAMSSQNVSGILQLANIYENEGATGAAHRLREYARSLPAVHAGPSPDQPPVPVTPAQPPVPPVPPVSPVETVTAHGEEFEEVPNESEFTESEEVASEE